MFVSYILSSVCLRLIQFVQLSFMQHIGLGVYSLPISLVITVSVLYLIIIIIKSALPPILRHDAPQQHDNI